MINFYNQVPTIYSNASRDFQYLGWLINIVLNSVKHNVDDLYDLPNNKADPKLSELLAMTLGFKIKRNYEQKQLIALVSIIPIILKYKGTKKAIELIGNTLVKTSGSVGSFSCKIKNGVLEVVLPDTLVDTTLFMDLLPYVLPAGMTCRVIRQTYVESVLEPIELSYNDSMQAVWHKDFDRTESTLTAVNLSKLFDIDQEPLFYNFRNKEDDNSVITGLMTNNIIPVIDGAVDESLYLDLKSEETKDEKNEGEPE